jgi:hypothetical protein
MKLSNINHIISEANWYNNKKYENVTDLLKQFQEDVGREAKDWYVSMTWLDKLGVNISTTFKTPAGIYCYPFEYVMSLNSVDKLPFATNRPFINIFRVNGDGNYITSRDNEADMDQYIEKLYNLGYDTTVDISKFDSTRSVFSELWLVTRELARGGKKVVKDNGWNSVGGTWSTENSRKWTVILRQLGIDGFIDYGTMTIHASEPTQAVFLTKGVINKNIRIVNRHVNKIRTDSGEIQYLRRDEFENYTKPDIIRKKFEQGISTKNFDVINNGIKIIKGAVKGGSISWSSVEYQILPWILLYIRKYNAYDIIDDIVLMFRKNGIEDILIKGFVRQMTKSFEQDLFEEFYKHIKFDHDKLKEVIHYSVDDLDLLKFLLQNDEYTMTLDDATLWDLFDYGTYKVKKLLKDFMISKKASQMDGNEP